MIQRSIGVHDAKTHLSEILREVAEGTIIVITRHGKPVAELHPPARRKERPVNMLRHLWDLPEGEELERLVVGTDEEAADFFYAHGDRAEGMTLVSRDQLLEKYSIDLMPC